MDESSVFQETLCIANVDSETPTLSGRFVVPNNVLNPIQAGGSPGDELVLVYRGTDRVAENSIYDETGHLLSDAGQRAYIENGSIDSAYASSNATHQNLNRPGF